MKLAVVGSRGFNDYELLKSVLDKIDIDVIVSGGANGADRLSERYAEENNIALEIYPADWDRYGKRAGYIRNRDIWEAATSGIAFWDGESRGTAHSFELSKKLGKKLFVYEYLSGKRYIV